MEKSIQKQVSLIEECDRAILCIDSKNKISFMSKGAERMFDLERDNEQGIEDIKLNGLANISEIIKGDCWKKVQVTTKDKITKNVLLNANSKFDKDKFLGAVLVGIECNALTECLNESLDMQKKDKKTFIQIRNAILISLARGKKTINQVSLDTSINWKTVEKHLTFLLGKKMVEEVFSSEYLRVFDITERGRFELKNLQNEKLIVS